MALGPIEVVMIAFPGNQFTGEIIPELTRLIEVNTISVIDALLVSKSADGDITFVEFDELGLDDDVKALTDLFEQADALISDDDVHEFAAGLDPNSSAALLVFEHTWSRPLRDAIVASGGVLALNFRVPGTVVDEIVAELASTQ
ncbi:MAG: DUF6325 family protein [Mycobacterium sp.]